MINLNGASVLITGGVGTFGSAAARMILKSQNPERLIIFSRGEHRQAEMAVQLRELNEQAGGPLRFFVGDVRYRARLALALRGVDYVIHAAALKRVEACEYNPQEAIATNIDGTQNLIEAAIMGGTVQKVIGISSDKAAAPTTLYGATKLAMERMFCAANALAGESGPRFMTVRYGNVLGSAGSVLPSWRAILKRQWAAAAGRTPAYNLPLTNPDMTRFFWTADDAVRFTLEAMTHFPAGQVLLPRIRSARMIDLAQVLVPDGAEFTLSVVGMRPGEKVHETMLSPDEEPFALDRGERGAEIAPLQLRIEEGLGDSAEGLCYNSGNPDFQMSADELVALIERHDREAADV